MFLVISQNSQEKTCARASFLIKLLFSLIGTIMSFIYDIYTKVIIHYRSSRPEMFCKKGVLKIHRKTPVPQSLFFNKVAGLRCFPVNFEKFLRTPFFIEHLWVTASELKKPAYKCSSGNFANLKQCSENRYLLIQSQ